VSLGGGVIGALHIPEKWFPGAVDRCLNSHNIMHVLVVLAVYSMHQVHQPSVIHLLLNANHATSLVPSTLRFGPYGPLKKGLNYKKRHGPPAENTNFSLSKKSIKNLHKSLLIL
jgi:hypothetical protein